VELTAAPLEAHDLYRFYHSGDEETLALRGVSLSVQPSETVALVGPSGSGKSTLLNCLAGLDEPDGGWVTVMGRRITRRPQAERAKLRASHIGMLLQSANLLEHLTIADNLALASSLASHKRGKADLERALTAVGLDGRGSALPAHLSGGELARAGLALALMNAPDILLADEPTGEVDAENEARILELIRLRSREGGANLIATHSQAVAAVADRVLHLVDGRIVE
jgi:putative ABC transport system ATP-binding protein